MNELIIKLFNKALPTNNKVDFAKINEKATKLGYLIHPDVANQEVSNWLDKQDVDFNSTFYKSWHDVTSKSRFELLIDQIVHYMSTYGTNHQGTPYIPNEGSDTPDFTKYKVILPITKEEVTERCLNMLYSGIALKQETIEDVLVILSLLDTGVDIEKVKNKEAKMFLYKASDTVPQDATEMVRYLVYLATGKTLLIKDKATIALIKTSKLDIRKFATKFGYQKLSSVFYRFKPIFLAFKGNLEMNYCINTLRRMAKENHTPMKAGFFETLLFEKKDLSDLVKRLDDITNFKKITLLQTINVRLRELDNRVFGIRNQKIWIRQGKIVVLAKDYYGEIFNIIYNNLVESLAKKATTITLPQGINITLPTSEKSFSGNYPLGTSFDLSGNNCIIGINWKEKDGARDLDFSLININGKKYGWNANYTNKHNSIIYSGDMTSANPEATELFYASEGFQPVIAKINLFSGGIGAKFKFFLAKEKIDNMQRGYMVNPDNILFTIDSEMDSKEKFIGVMTGEKFILAQFRTGRGRVSYNSITDLYTEYALSTLDCYLSLEQLLIDAGFTFVEKDATIDLTNLSKDSLISLLSK